jgi:enterochelin esterase-like enzyme
MTTTPIIFLLTQLVGLLLALSESLPVSSRATTSTISSASSRRTLTPPFPNGLCGGRIITIPPEDTYGIDVNLANINLGGDLILPPRDIRVWLPPDYSETSTNRHPVLYVHDGNNAMDDQTSWTGRSWRLTGALTRLADHHLLKEHHPLPIFVLLPTVDEDLFPGIRRRHLEYGDMSLPWAGAHVDFVAKTLKPLIDNRFATDPSAEATFSIGASLGGQAALNLLLKYPDLFGGAACLSPAFGPTILREVTKRAESLKNKKLYLDIGGDIQDVKVPWIDLMDHFTPHHWWNPGYWWLDTQLQTLVTAMTRALDQAGVDYCYHQVPGGRHNERAWALRIDKPLLHLYGQEQYSCWNHE